MNQPVQGWIRKSPVIAFFIAAIAICYLAFFSAIYFIPHDKTLSQILIYYLSSLTVCGVGCRMTIRRSGRITEVKN